MKGFPFKRYLILLGVVVLLIGVTVPLATFAKSPSAVSQASSKVRSFNFTRVDLFCSTDVPLPPVVDALHTGDKVSGTATLTTNNPTTQGTLVLLDSAGTFVKSITSAAGKTAFSFTVTSNNDTLFACMQQGQAQDTITVTGTVTSSTPPRVTPIVKHITLNGHSTLKAIENQVQSAISQELHQLKLKFDVTLACTEDLVGISQLKTLDFVFKGISGGQTLQTLGNVIIDFKKGTTSKNLDIEFFKAAGAGLDFFVPGFGCAKAIVNFVSDGGIDLLGKCLTDRGCLDQVEHDKDLRHKICIAIKSIEFVVPRPIAAIIHLAERRLC